MKVILKCEVAGLGEEGDILTISDGYARNYLFPARQVVMCNNQNLAVLKSQQKAIEKRKSDRRVMYMSTKEKLESMTLVVKMKTGESGHLFGAVTSTVVQEELAKLGMEVFKKQIIIPHHSIKELGEYDIEVKLLGKITAMLHVIVEDVEGKVQAKSNDTPTPEQVVEGEKTEETTGEQEEDKSVVSETQADSASATDTHSEYGTDSNITE